MIMLTLSSTSLFKWQLTSGGDVRCRLRHVVTCLEGTMEGSLVMFRVSGRDGNARAAISSLGDGIVADIPSSPSRPASRNEPLIKALARTSSSSPPTPTPVWSAITPTAARGLPVAGDAHVAGPEPFSGPWPPSRDGAAAGTGRPLAAEARSGQAAERERRLHLPHGAVLVHWGGGGLFPECRHCVRPAPRYLVAEDHQIHTSSPMHFIATTDHFIKENYSCNIDIDSQQTEISNQILPPSQPPTGSMEARNFQADSNNLCCATYSDQLDPSLRLPEFYHLNPDNIYTAAACDLLTDEELLRATIAASLKQSRIDQNSKLEIPKSSVSSLRLQQLQQMGFSTEKAVLALAASGKMEGAINLLVEDQVGEDAVVTTKDGIKQCSVHGSKPLKTAS
ncbi:rhomboid domain-containing protein 3 isoform X3 [Narcine bancroftii]|uniref:rhomboid domain-containing protein 3 isoform X3 n=1 Tax=Narcine bancroftii TaxID=1343680 RepID=UPI003831D3DA